MKSGSGISYLYHEKNTHTVNVYRTFIKLNLNESKERNGIEMDGRYRRKYLTPDTPRYTITNCWLIWPNTVTNLSRSNSPSRVHLVLTLKFLGDFVFGSFVVPSSDPMTLIIRSGCSFSFVIVPLFLLFSIWPTTINFNPT